MTRADRHRLLDMQEAVEDLSAIVARGRAAWDGDKFARLAAQKLLEILGEAAKQVSDDVRSRFPVFRGVIWRACATSTPMPTPGGF